MRIEVSEDDLALIIEALDDNANVFDEGVKDDSLSLDEQQQFARDAERCRTLADRLGFAESVE